MDDVKLGADAVQSALGAIQRDRREDSYWRSEARRLQSQIASQETIIDLLTTIESRQVQPSPFGQPSRARGKRRGIVNLVLSDMHFDEVVKPEQVNGLNAYDRQIGEMRLKATIHKTIRLTRDLTTGISFDGIQVWLGGDSVSGDIHDELKKTNDGQHVIDSIDFWADHLAGALVALADAYGKVHVVCQYGNHGRSSKKPEAKDSIRSSFDWLLYRMVIRSLASDERITWTVPESRMVLQSVYSSTYLFEHGDNFKGGDQIAGPIRPVMFGAKKRRETLTFTKLVVGHFHRYADIPDAVMNGSLVGYNEYAHMSGFKFEPPKQAFWIESVENGPLFSTAIMPSDPKAEGWS